MDGVARDDFDPEVCDFRVERDIERRLYGAAGYNALLQMLGAVNQNIGPFLNLAQVERVRKTRAERDAAAAMAALGEVESAARSGENLMPRIIAAVEAYAALGEVADARRRAFGEYSEAI